jgi:hypothetical protein
MAMTTVLTWLGVAGQNNTGNSNRSILANGGPGPFPLCEIDVSDTAPAFFATLTDSLGNPFFSAAEVRNLNAALKGLYGAIGPGNRNPAVLAQRILQIAPLDGNSLTVTAQLVLGTLYAILVNVTAATAYVGVQKPFSMQGSLGMASPGGGGGPSTPNNGLGNQNGLQNLTGLGLLVALDTTKNGVLFDAGVASSSHLPAAASVGALGTMYSFVSPTGATGPGAIAPNGAETIDGTNAPAPVPAGYYRTLESVTGGWVTIGYGQSVPVSPGTTQGSLQQNGIFHAAATPVIIGGGAGQPAITVAGVEIPSTASGPSVVQMPPPGSGAGQAPESTGYYVANDSNYPVSVQNSAAALIATLYPDQAAQFVLSIGGSNLWSVLSLNAPESLQAGATGSIPIASAANLMTFTNSDPVAAGATAKGMGIQASAGGAATGAAPAGAGGLVGFGTGAGGVASAAFPGGAGGNLVILIGAGGAGSAAQLAGAGGGVNLTAGAGGVDNGGGGGVGGELYFASGPGAASNGGAAGNGGLLQIIGGNGGAAGTGAAGQGGPVSIVSGSGGAASGTQVGGNGALVTLSAGSGGNGTATQLPGYGGDVSISAGVAGADGGAGGVAGGSVALTAGNGSTGGQGGTISQISGQGGAASATQAAGPGGPIQLTSGGGGAASAAQAAAAGGTISISSGSGGAGSAAKVGANGGQILVLAGFGGIDGGDGAGTGGLVSITAGTGGAANGTAAGPGGPLTLTAGSGGQGLNANPGAIGGTGSLFGGAGGAAGATSAGGLGGYAFVKAGDGGAGNATHAAGQGGLTEILGGNGGAANFGPGASGGGVSISGGNATGSGNTNGGAVSIESGAPRNAGLWGGILLGTGGPEPVQIASSTGLIGFFGTAPIVRQTAAGYSTVAAGGATPAFRNDTYNGGSGTAYTLGDVIVILKAYGLLAP